MTGSTDALQFSRRLLQCRLARESSKLAEEIMNGVYFVA